MYSLVEELSMSCSSGCVEAAPYVCMLLLTWFLTISVDAQNKGADSTYSIGIHRWNTPIFGSLSYSLGNMKSTESIHARQTQMGM